MRGVEADYFSGQRIVMYRAVCLGAVRACAKRNEEKDGKNDSHGLSSRVTFSIFGCEIKWPGISLAGESARPNAELKFGTAR
jgi:hypothetical protein